MLMLYIKTMSYSNLLRSLSSDVSPDVNPEHHSTQQDGQADQPETSCRKSHQDPPPPLCTVEHAAHIKAEHDGGDAEMRCGIMLGSCEVQQEPLRGEERTG